MPTMTSTPPAPPRPRRPRGPPHPRAGLHPADGAARATRAGRGRAIVEIRVAPASGARAVPATANRWSPLWSCGSAVAGPVPDLRSQRRFEARGREMGSEAIAPGRLRGLQVTRHVTGPIRLDVPLDEVPFTVSAGETVAV